MCEIDGAQIVLEPIADPAVRAPSPGAGLRVPGSLRAKRVGIVDNRLVGMAALADALEPVLAESHGATVRRWIVPHSVEPDASVIVSICSNVDVVVIGLGNCGACTTWQCGLSATLRGHRIPTLDIVTEPFAQLARSVFCGHGLSEQPLFVLPAGVESSAARDIAQQAAAVAAACSNELATEPAP